MESNFNVCVLDVMKYHYKFTKTVKDCFNKIQANLGAQSRHACQKHSLPLTKEVHQFHLMKRWA